MTVRDPCGRASYSEGTATGVHSVTVELPMNARARSAPLIHSRLWRFINLFTYLLTYLLTYFTLLGLVIVYSTITLCFIMIFISLHFALFDIFTSLCFRF